jgi:hypothetical protein
MNVFTLTIVFASGWGSRAHWIGDVLIVETANYSETFEGFSIISNSSSVSSVLNSRRSIGS